MAKIKCFDVVNMLVEDNSEELKDSVKVSQELLEKLQFNCALMDEISDTHEGLAYECEIKEDNLDIVLSLHCPIFEATEKNDAFYRLMRRSKKYIMDTSSEDDDNVCISFVVDGVWVQVK